jgi:hypothetical protein
MNPESPSALSLAEVGLFNLLQRIHAGTTGIDRFLWHSLVERQLVTDGWPPRLTEAGVQQLQALACRHAAATERGAEPA